MAIQNYRELKEAIRQYINYGDASVEDNLEFFIRIAYDNINSSLRIPSTELYVTHTVTESTTRKLPIPNNFVELKRIYYNDTYETLKQIDIEVMPQAYHVSSQYSLDNRPTQFARDGAHWILNREPVQGTKLVFIYWQNVPYPEEDEDSDVFIQQVGSTLLYRSLAEAYRFLEDMETSEYYMQKALQEIMIVQENADTAEVTGSVVTQSMNPWY